MDEYLLEQKGDMKCFFREIKYFILEVKYRSVYLG